MRTCEDCGANLPPPGKKGGRPATRCSDCRAPRYGEPNRDQPAINARRTAKRHRLSGGGSALYLAQRLAVGLSILADPGLAAELVGLELEPDRLTEIEALARQHFEDMIAGDLDALDRSLMMAANLMAVQLVQSLPELSAHDLPHAFRAIAQSRQLLNGGRNPTQFASVNLSIVGADGQPISLSGPTPLHLAKAQEGPGSTEPPPRLRH